MAVSGAVCALMMLMREKMGSVVGHQVVVGGMIVERKEGNFAV